MIKIVLTLAFTIITIPFKIVLAIVRGLTKETPQSALKTSPAWAKARLCAGTVEKVALAYVVDGDTIHVAGDRGEARVRLIGMDTPESKDNRQAREQACQMGVPVESVIQAGRASTRHIKEILGPQGSELFLEYDRKAIDGYGRILAYVWKDGVMVNREMVESGYAVPLLIPPNGRQAKDFIRLYREARKEGRGLWREQASVLCGFLKLLLAGRDSPALKGEFSEVPAIQTGRYPVSCRGGGDENNKTAGDEIEERFR